jgi:hypothetical protein
LLFNHILFTNIYFRYRYQAGNAVIIVDPSNMQIIAKATDQTRQHDTSAEGKELAEVKADDTFSLDESTENNGNLLQPSSRLSKFNNLNMEISCINPLGWMNLRTTEQKPLPCEGCFAWHPLRHAAIVAIENAAERDRMLFPSSTPIAMPDSNGNLEDHSGNEPAKRLKTDTEVSLVACHKFLTAMLLYKLSIIHFISSVFFLTRSNLNFRIKSNLQMNHSAATCLKPPDHISAQDLISTLFGSHARCMFNDIYFDINLYS